ncbi:phosphotransferase [Candidatus Dependentiae bacterium]|nr:phosphotransferase [Candidatus Dependentiae bacterium]
MTKEKIQELTKLTGLKDITRLTGDASDRIFYRGLSSDNKSFIIMDYEKELTHTSSEFQVLRAYGLMKLYEIKIPKIFKVIPNAGLVIMQDIGDNTLLKIIEEKQLSEYDLKKIYLNAMNEIIKIKNIPIRMITKIKGETFSKDKFKWEENFFFKYYIKKYKNISLTSDQKKILKDFFKELNKTVYASVGFTIHRDFHSRNLLHFNGKVFNVDFQDLRIGPEHYDIASLIWDSYVDIDDELKDYIIRRYIDFSGKEYETDFNLILYTALQRNLKAIATFCYLAFEKGKTKYEQYIPLTLKHFKLNFSQLKLNNEILDIIL